MAKIVVVDDQFDICLSIKDRLIEDGHDVRISRVGDEAIDYGYLFEPDLLITDWRLESEYDGLEVAEAFHFANEHIKTVLITGYSIEEIESRTENLGIYKTVLKPFSMEEISQVVSDVLETDSIENCSAK